MPESTRGVRELSLTQTAQYTGWGPKLLTEPALHRSNEKKLKDRKCRPAQALCAVSFSTVPRLHTQSKNVLTTTLTTVVE